MLHTTAFGAASANEAATAAEMSKNFMISILRDGIAVHCMNLLSQYGEADCELDCGLSTILYARPPLAAARHHLLQLPFRTLKSVPTVHG